MQDYLRFTYDAESAETASFFDECSLWAARFGLLLLNNLELRPNLQILDLACGTGFPLFELAHSFGSTCQITGVDNWKGGIERARAKLQFYQLANVQLLEADARHLPLPDASFDLIISNLGINNFANPDAVMAECMRVARPKARLVMTTNLSGHMAEFYTAFRATLHELGKSAYLERLAQNESHRGTKEGFVELLQSNDFRIVNVKEEQFQLRYLNGSALLNHHLSKIGFLGGWRQTVKPEDEEQIFAHLENKLNQLAQAQSELRMSVPMLYLEGEKSA
ncbi:class I SAM-dependent methyltransferase [Ktedonosporobacter rubrisoli]|uniref:Class I SAM-dependent methyltransferase n=1 Tax=Ktedonosporobacter rubrisoli TaxID=2509675 RepID=A0A4P6JT49_KTERU|nr:class I SAM-dependent methyltransferase [Ktedonosporobacter rubrisoli]QBD78738.1 class I SAM-dependent methyltransferase [Ktedonosporobacter rubrisoli]